MEETENQKECQNKPRFPGIQEFFVNTSLYTEFDLSNEEAAHVFGIVHTSDSIDCFCVECGSNSIFQTEGRKFLEGSGITNDRMSVSSAVGGNKKVKVSDYIYQKEFTCSRNPSHKILFLVQIKNGLISKIGQSPSFAVLAKHGIKKYRKILGENHYQEFCRAVGLYAHGIGIGSFVYHRRIIENFLIKSAYEEAKKSPDWNEGKYKDGRVAEKMTLLKAHLPEYLVQNKAIYSIVSKGIHELTEEECLEYFPIVRTCLELIFTEMEAKREREQKKKELQKEIEKIAGKTN